MLARVVTAAVQQVVVDVFGVKVTARVNDEPYRLPRQVPDEHAVQVGLTIPEGAMVQYGNHRIAGTLAFYLYVGGFHAETNLVDAGRPFRGRDADQFARQVLTKVLAPRIAPLISNERLRKSLPR